MKTPETPETTKRRKFLQDNVANPFRYWISKKGINLLKIDFKTSRGRTTDELCLVVGVTKKLPKEEVVRNSLFLVPEFITFYVDNKPFYVKTDVVQTGALVGE